MIIWLLASILFKTEPNVVANPVRQQNVSTASDAIGKPADKLGSNLMVVYHDSAGNHWLAGQRATEGVYRFDGEQLTVFSTRDGLCSNSILTIQEDKKGNIYFDTPKGVSRLDGKSFTTLKVTAGGEWKLTPDDLWFSMGTERDGPYRFDGTSLFRLKFPHIKRADEYRRKFPNATWSPYGIYTMYRDEIGAMWFGTAALGACRYDGKSHRWLFEDHLTTTPAGGSFGIRSIVTDNGSAYWFCNPRFRFEVPQEQPVEHVVSYKRHDGVAASGEDDVPYFMSMAKDNKGHLWMATYDDGVWRNDGQKLVKYPIKDGKTEVLQWSVYMDRKGALWLGTHNAGVFRFDGKRFVRFRVR